MTNSLIKGKGGAGGGREGGERSTRYSGNFGARGRVFFFGMRFQLGAITLQDLIYLFKLN